MGEGGGWGEGLRTAVSQYLSLSTVDRKTRCDGKGYSPVEWALFWRPLADNDTRRGYFVILLFWLYGTLKDQRGTYKKAK